MSDFHPSRYRPKRLRCPKHSLEDFREHKLQLEIGKRHAFESLRHWFQALYGVENWRELIAEARAEA